MKQFLREQWHSHPYALAYWIALVIVFVICCIYSLFANSVTAGILAVALFMVSAVAFPKEDNREDRCL